MRNFTHRCPKSGHFFSKLGQVFLFLKKGRGDLPPSPSSYAPAYLLQSEHNKKMRVKRSRNMKYLFYKNNAKKNGTFHKQIMLKCGNKHTRIICDTCSKLSIRAQKQRRIFSLWTTFNNSCDVLVANFQQTYSFGSSVFFNTSFLCFKIQSVVVNTTVHQNKLF